MFCRWTLPVLLSWFYLQANLPSNRTQHSPTVHFCSICLSTSRFTTFQWTVVSAPGHLRIWSSCRWFFGRSSQQTAQVVFNSDSPFFDWSRLSRPLGERKLRNSVDSGRTALHECCRHGDRLCTGKWKRALVWMAYLSCFVWAQIQAKMDWMNWIDNITFLNICGWVIIENIRILASHFGKIRTHTHTP